MSLNALVRCFGLLTVVALILLGVDRIWSKVTGKNPVSVHEILPLTSINLIRKPESRRFFAPKKTQEETADLEANAVQKVTLLLKNGSEITGQIAAQDPEWVTLKVDGSEVGFHRNEILDIKHSGTKD